MASTWTTLDDALFDPEKPLIQSTGLALKHNCIAIAEGAANAPRIETAGIDDEAVTNAKIKAPVAADDYVIAQFGIGNYHTDTSALYEFRCLISGSVRVKFEHKDSTVAIYRMNASDFSVDTIESHANPGGSYTARSTDITMNIGDIIRVAYTIAGTGTPGIRYGAIYSQNNTFAVA